MRKLEKKIPKMFDSWITIMIVSNSGIFTLRPPILVWSCTIVRDTRNSQLATCKCIKNWNHFGLICYNTVYLGAHESLCLMRNSIYMDLLMFTTRLYLRYRNQNQCDSNSYVRWEHKLTKVSIPIDDEVYSISNISNG